MSSWFMLITHEANPILFEKIKNSTRASINSALSLYKITKELLNGLRKKIVLLQAELQKIDELHEAKRIVQKKIKKLDALYNLIFSQQERLSKVIIALNDNTIFFHRIDNHIELNREHRDMFFKNNELTHCKAVRDIKKLEWDMDLSAFFKANQVANENQEIYRVTIYDRNLILRNRLAYCKPILLFSCVPCFFAGLFLGIEVAPLLGFGGFLAFWMTGILIGCLLSGLAAVGEHLIEKYGYQDYITLKDSETFGSPGIAVV